MTNTQQNKTLVRIGLLSSIFSIGIHGYLALSHYKLKFGLAEGPSICNINEHFNCDAVSLSQYSDFLGLPIASLGAFTHLALSTMLLMWLIGLVKEPSRTLRLASWVSIFILLMSIIMGSISSLKLGTYCIFCVVTYLLSFVLAFCLVKPTFGSLLKNASTDFRALIQEQRWILVCFILVPAAAKFADSVVGDSYGLSEMKLKIEESIQTWKNSTHKDFRNDAGLVFQSGSGETQVTIVEFADYLCPHCKAASEPLHNFVQAHQGMRLVYKPFSLDGICNDEKIPKHDGLRCQLIYATFCAQNLKQKGWAIHDYIFEHQTDWQISNFENDLNKMSKEFDLNFEQMKDCMNKSEIHQQALDIAKEGSGIKGTPTIFVNGKELPYGSFLPILQSAVESLNP